MKKIISLLSFALLLCSCEKAPINLTDENIELRLESMIGENINSVSNTLKAEGFQKMKFENQINFTKNKETYLLKATNKIIISAGYQISDTTKTYKFFDKYHYKFETKTTDNYIGEIYAIEFSDWGQGYIDSVKVNLHIRQSYIILQRPTNQHKQPNLCIRKLVEWRKKQKQNVEYSTRRKSQNRMHNTFRFLNNQIINTHKNKKIRPQPRTDFF